MGVRVTSLFLVLAALAGSSSANDYVCLGPNEIWTECDNNSCQRNCETFHLTNLACKPICTPGCICKKGFLRNTQGVCVVPNDCDVPVCPAENQEYTGCVVPCGETCANLGSNVICNFLVCNPGCDCKPGFFKNSTGSCVEPSQCDCPNNQYLQLCNQPCPPERCQDIGKVFKCAVTKDCKPACKCQSGYRRNSEGDCIPTKDCPEYRSRRQVYTKKPEFRLLP